MSSRLFSTPVLASAIVALLAAGCQPPRPAVDSGGRTMGTLYSVQATQCPARDCAREVDAAIANELQRLESILSHYDPASDLSRFNANNSDDWIAVPEELVEVVALAAGVAELSHGAFDITVADAVNAWGFGPAPRPDSTPAAGPAPGYAAIDWQPSPPALRKLSRPLRLDLSGIAKGYAVDRIAYLLEASGITDYVVEIGGELRTAGARPDGTPWRIGIERPDTPAAAQPDIRFVVMPGNAAIASSGDYRNFYELGGERVSHTIDPRTGAPSRNGTVGVSVIAPSAAQADALATAFMVLGLDAGLALAEREGIAALFYTRDGDTLRSAATSAFESYLMTR